MVTDDQRRMEGRSAEAGVRSRARRWPGLVAGVVMGGMVAGGAESGRFVVPADRGDIGSEFAYWDLFLADDDGFNHGFANPPGLLGGEDEDGNPTTLTDGVGLTQTGATMAFVTSSGAIYSFDETTAFRVDYTAGSGEEPVTSVIFQTQTGGRRLELDSIRLEYVTGQGGSVQVVEVGPVYKALDDPQTGSFAERLVSAFQWDLSGRGVRSFRIVFGAPGSSMPLWEAQLDVRRGEPFVPQLGYVVVGETRPRLRYQVPGRISKNLPAGAETRFHLEGSVLRLSGVPSSGFSVAGWKHGGVVVEEAELSVTFADSDVPVTAIFAPLGYVTWRTHWFDHANAVLGTPADHLNEAVSGPEADPDGDGATNFAEFAFGGDPYVADAVGLAAGVAEEGGVLTLTYRQPASSEVGVYYQLMGSVDMRVWEPVEMVMVARVLDDSGYWRVTVREGTTRDGGAHPFLRMEATTKP